MNVIAKSKTLNFYLFKIFFLLFICGSLCAQEDKVVAKVGNYKIYESEFQERFDFSVHPKLLQKVDKLAAKEEFLHQLIAEKLLSLEAKEQGYNTTELFKDIITPLKNMYVRDALYTQEVKNKTSYPQNEISDGVEKIKKVLNVKFIFSNDEQELQKVYNQLEAGASFDSLLASRPESTANPKEITFGSMDKKIENIVYKLKPGEFTSPIGAGDGYYILELIDVSQNTDLKNPEMTYEDVKRIVETRAERNRYLDYHYSFFSDYKITAHRGIFEKLVKNLVLQFKEKYLNQNLAAGKKSSEEKINKYYLRGGEVSTAVQNLDSESRNKIFINISQRPVKVDYFVNQLSQDGFFVSDLNEISIRASLSSYIRKFIEDQLLAVEGYKEGLENSPEVEKYMRMWEDCYLSKMLMTTMFDSIKVSEKEAYSVYEQNDWKDTPLELVNVAEVLTDSLDLIEKVLNELSNGADIKDLAKRYTERDSLKDKGGEFGFFPITEHGDIGRIASQMKIGNVYGPIKLDEGYSVYQIIGKKEDTTVYTKSYGQVKDQLIAKITLAKFEKYVNEYNARLASKYGVEINEDVLKNIDDIFMNLVIVRYMGFGGEIFAVPYTEQYSGWYDIWLKNKNLLQ